MTEQDHRPTARRAAPVLTLDDVHVRYGGSHILQGVSFDVARRPASRRCWDATGSARRRPSRRSSDWPRGPGGSCCAATRSRGTTTARIVRGRHRLRARRTARSSAASPSRRTCGWPTPTRASTPRVVGRALPRPRRATRAAGRHAVRRSAADGRRWRGSCCARTRSCSSTNRRRASRPSSSPRSPTCWRRWRATTPILLVEQNLPLVRRIADRVVVLDAGKVVHRGAAADLVADASLHA